MFKPAQVPSHLTRTQRYAGVPAICGVALDKVDRPRRTGITALPQLRTLTLRQTTGSRHLLRAPHLPATLEEVILMCDDPLSDTGNARKPPLLFALDELHLLRRVTFAGYTSWPLRGLGYEEQPSRRVRLPSSMEVCTAVAAQPTRG